MAAFREVEGIASLDIEVYGRFKLVWLGFGWDIEEVLEETAASRARERSRRALALRRFSSWVVLLIV